jgi:hypothetical protein
MQLLDLRERLLLTVPEADAARGIRFGYRQED